MVIKLVHKYYQWNVLIGIIYVRVSDYILIDKIVREIAIPVLFDIQKGKGNISGRLGNICGWIYQILSFLLTFIKGF
ncbi:MAG: hypothetical protein HQK91_11700 [Nitrospirae bacterium]|nr:hypothetical protein [Nitrospirota bacterium]